MTQNSRVKNKIKGHEFSCITKSTGPHMVTMTSALLLGHRAQLQKLVHKELLEFITQPWDCVKTLAEAGRTDSLG